MNQLAINSPNRAFITKIKNDLIAIEEPLKRDLAKNSRKVLRYVIGEKSKEKDALLKWVENFLKDSQIKFSSHLYSELPNKAINIEEIKPYIR